MRYESIHNYLLMYLTSLFLGVAMIIPSVHSATLTDDFIEKPGGAGALTMNNSLKLEFDNGSVLRLFEIKDKSGVTLGFVVRETSQHATQRISQQPILRRSNPVDLLWAVTTVGTRIPDTLLKVYGKPDRTRQQGWARTELGLGNPPSEGGGNFCIEQQDFASFSNDILGFGYGLAFLSDNDGPQSKPQHWYDDENNYFRLTGTAYDVRAFYAEVVHCFIDPDAEFNYDFPWWGYDYRVAGGQWENIDGGEFENPGADDSFWWQPGESPSSLPGTELDFRIRFGNVLPGNLFRIGATWSKPFDTLSSK